MADLATSVRPLAPRPLGIPPARTITRSSLAPVAALIALLVAYALCFGWLSLGRYWAYQMHALDMGNMGQAAWNTIHGHPFRFTNMRLPYKIEAWNTTTRLSFHVEALFPVISLIYFIYPHPESLLLLQTLALALGAVPAYLLARDILAQPWLGVVFAAAYLLFPSLEAMNLYEFHPVSLATPLLLFAFLFAQRRQYRLFVVSCLAAMGTKEEIGLVVALFGLYVAVVNRDRRVGLGMAAVGAVWSLAAVFVVERHYRLPGTKTYMQARYAYLGHGLHGLLHTVFRDPGAFGRVLSIWPKLWYLLGLLAPLGFLALLAPAVLLLGAPTLVLNLFSQDFHMYSGLGDNSAELISIILIAAIFGARLVLQILCYWVKPRTAAMSIGAYILFAALVGQHFEGYTPLGELFQSPTIGSHQHLADRFVAMVPAAAPVATQDQLDPHLSSRRYLYLFQDTGRQPPPPMVPADYILLDVSSPTYPQPSFQLHDAAEKWIHTKDWGVAAADDGLILIRRGARSRSIAPQFYSYAFADGASIDHRLRARISGLDILGYNVQQTDLPNHRISNLAFTIYLRPIRHLDTNLQPFIFETMGRHLIQCAGDPLGLAWFPTSQWKVGHAYRVRMNPLETNWQSPGTARLYITLGRALTSKPPDCARLWSRHGKLWPAGTVDIQF
jgi:uncharacterized membrane protein